MAFRFAVLAVVASLLSLSLSGCSSSAEDPMSNELRSAIRQDRASAAWATVSEMYPEALRPEINVGAVLDDAAWAIATVKCFKDEGFIVVRAGLAFQYSSSQGQSPLQFAVAQYHCTIALPSLTEVAGYLDVYQLGDLYDYYRQRVQPCLALNGVRVSTPPARGRFVDGFGSDSWSPFAAVAGSRTAHQRRLANLREVCPPLPGWLHL